MGGLTVQCLPARQGDAIWIRWGDGHQIMLDMGTERVGRNLRARLEALPEDQRRFDLLVVTHVDEDHIGGVLSCLADPDDPLPGLVFDDIWFNGWDHLHGRSTPVPGAPARLESMGPVQGERLTSWLRDQPWNEAFGRGPVVRDDGPLGAPTDLGGGVSVTILGPTQERLAAHVDTWREDVERALAAGQLEEAAVAARPAGGLEAFGQAGPPPLETREDLEDLADTRTPTDSSLANACSISFLLTWEGRRLLFTGDALGEDLVAGLRLVDGGTPVPVDVLKVPHHGSKNNVTDELVAAVTCGYWLFSSDGTRYDHPDAIAIARILRSSAVEHPVLAFNVPSEFNGWWRNPDWRSRFGYAVEYGEEPDGIVVTLEPT